ncbi:MAG: IS6 family transposase [Chloroflexi bacterium]|nr:IS6 family transposase [Chloroflexota bacterium]
MEYKEVTCKFCQSRHVIKYGHNKGVQNWKCKDCGHKFVDNDALPGMKTPSPQVSSALNMYYEGMSLNAIRRHLNQTDNNYPSDSTVYEWVTKHSEPAIEQAKKMKPQVGDLWIADETVLKIDGKNLWLWDVIDDKTRFLLATRLSRSRTAKDAQIMFDRAFALAGKKPKTVITDKLASYLGVAYGKGTEHKQGGPFNIETNSNLIERFHGTLKQRTKIMRGLKDIVSARDFLDAWLVNYNYFRPHEGIDNWTPGEAAKVMNYPYRNWNDVLEAQKPKVRVITVRESEAPMLRDYYRPSLKAPRISPSSFPRLSPRAPRLTLKTPKLEPNVMYGRGGMLSRRPFRGARRFRLH